MAQPTRYVRTHDFSDQQALTPDVPLNGDWVDTELDALAETTDDLCDNLALLQRDDGALNNGIVSMDSLSQVVKAAISAGDGDLDVGELIVGAFGPAIAGVDEKVTPADTDLVPLADSAASNALKKLSWSNLKTAVLAYVESFFLRKVSTQAALKAILAPVAATYSELYVRGRYASGDGYEGFFRWDSADCAADVAADPAGGLVVAPSGADGSTGAWRRVMSDGRVNVLWFGAVRAATEASTVFATLGECQVVYPHATALTNYLDWLATQAAINAYPGREIYLPGNSEFAAEQIYRWDQSVTISGDNTALVGDGHGISFVYYTNAADTAIVISPEDTEATEYISRPRLQGFRIASLASDATGIGVEMVQCSQGRIIDVDLFGFPKSIRNAGGAGNMYDRIVTFADPSDDPVAGSYSMLFEAANRGSNGYQHSFSHNVSNFYLGAAGAEHCLFIRMADGLNFTNGYCKLGSVSGVNLEPDASGYGINTTGFVNTYLDGHSSVTQYGVRVPAFGNAGVVGNVTFGDGCIIANCDQGSNVRIQNPVGSGEVWYITFNGVTFGACAEECFDVTNTDGTLVLDIRDCMIRNSDGGIGVAGAKSVTIRDVTFVDVTNGSGVACVQFSGTIGAYSVTGVHINRDATSPATDFADTATVAAKNAWLDGNTTTGTDKAINGEGTVTPSLRVDGSATGITYSSRTCRWRRRGSEMEVWAELVLSDKGAGTGNVSINLATPRVASANGQVSIAAAALDTSITAPPQAYITTGATLVSLYRLASGVEVVYTDAQITDTSSFLIHATYPVA